MSKNISTALQTDIERGVLTTAILLEVTRNDGKVVRVTNHDAPITFENNVYRADIPFTISALQAGSDLGVDTGDIEIAVDGTAITKDDIDNGAYKNGQLRIMQVDWSAPEDGSMTMRRGWFSRLESNKNSALKIEIFGLLKILDFSVGRIYQPSCDADLGDRRCRVAIDLGQRYSHRNLYEVGDWVFVYDESALTALPIDNGSFEDGATLADDPIPGWTKSPSSRWFVTDDSPYQPTDTAADGDFWVESALDTDATGEITYLYQDLDLTVGGPNLTDLDDGQIIFLLTVSILQTSYLLDPPRIACEMYDADDRLVEVKDTDFFTVDQIDHWRDKSLSFPLLPGVRRIRIYLYGKRTDADFTNCAFDNVRPYYYNHTLVSPNSFAIHKMCRVTQAGSERELYYAPNGSFEAQAAVANSDSNTVGSGGITNWTKTAGSYWLTESDEATDGTLRLTAGDDGSGVQKTYTIYTTFDAARASGAEAARIALGFLTGVVYGDILFDNDQGRAQVQLQFLDEGSAEISTFTAYALANPGEVGGGTLSFSKAFSAPLDAVSIRLRLSVETPTGTSVGNIGFDNLRFHLYDPERPTRADPVNAAGSADTIFDTDVGDYTYDDELIWKAHTSHVMFDEVATVTDRKVFSATTITGVEGSYETSLIRWLSGANAGAYNLIRVWTPTGKVIKLYFPTVDPIQTGDRFMYVRSCQKRFFEDCRLRFDNAVNFQGFPYLPGKIS